MPMFVILFAQFLIRGCSVCLDWMGPFSDMLPLVCKVRCFQSMVLLKFTELCFTVRWLVLIRFLIYLSGEIVY